jgi:ribosomal subunit interface protein
MQLTVKGRQIDIGESLRAYVETELARAVEKYFANPIEATVSFSAEAHLFKADILVHVGRDMLLQSTGEALEPYPAFDAALARIAKRLRRYKRRLRDHHAGAAGATLRASQFILAERAGLGPVVETGDDAGEEGGDPVVIAELQTPILAMTVAQAVMHMDLADQPALMFKNSAHGGLNMIYRRADGHIGWVDPGRAD